MRHVHQVLECRNCLSEYTGGRDSFPPGIPYALREQYCPECAGAVHQALQAIPAKYEHIWLPVANQEKAVAEALQYRNPLTTGVCRVSLGLRAKIKGIGVEGHELREYPDGTLRVYAKYRRCLADNVVQGYPGDYQKALAEDEELSTRWSSNLRDCLVSEFPITPPEPKVFYLTPVYRENGSAHE